MADLAPHGNVGRPAASQPGRGFPHTSFSQSLADKPAPRQTSGQDLSGAPPELNRRMNETLEALARAIFTSWFVDFDPVRAKAEGRPPIGMDADTAALFPDCFVDSPLEPIPSGWQVMPIGDAVTVLGGATPRTGCYRNWCRVQCACR